MKTDVPLEELPVSWQETIKALRKDAHKMRRERNEAREALATATIAFAALACAK